MFMIVTTEPVDHLPEGCPLTMVAEAETASSGTGTGTTVMVRVDAVLTVGLFITDPVFMTLTRQVADDLLAHGKHSGRIGAKNSFRLDPTLDRAKLAVVEVVPQRVTPPPTDG